MRIFLIFGAIIPLFLILSFNKKNIDANVCEVKMSELIKKFKYKNVSKVSEKIIRKELGNQGYLLERLNNNEVSCFFPANILTSYQNSNSEIYAYSYFDSKSKYIPILQVVMAEDYYGGVLVIVDSIKKNISDYIEVLGGTCQGAYLNESNNVEWCSEKGIIFTSNTSFYIYTVSFESDDFISGSPMRVDSVSIYYNILTTGKLEEIKVDSVRYNSIAPPIMR